MKPATTLQSHLNSEIDKAAAEKAEKVKKLFEEYLNKVKSKDEKVKAKAFYHLGRCYKKGTGIDKDLTKAFQYFEQSANLNSKHGQTSIAVCYLDGCGVKKNAKKAVHWLLKSAEQGEASAQNILGVCFFEGKGADVDKKGSKEYFELAAAQEYGPAIENLERFFGKTSQDTSTGTSVTTSAAAAVSPSQAVVHTMPAPTQTQSMLSSAIASSVMFSDPGKSDEKNSAEIKKIVDIKVSINSMIEELKTYITNNDKSVKETGNVMWLAQTFVTIGGYFPSSPASKILGGNKPLKLKNAKDILSRLEALIIDDSKVKVAIGLIADVGVAMPTACASANTVSTDIPSELNKILNDFTTLDLAAGGGKEIFAIIEKYKQQLKNFNEDLGKIAQHAAQSAAQTAAQSAALPPLMSTASVSPVTPAAGASPASK